MTHEKLMTAEERVRAMERRMGPCHDDERPTIIATMEAHAAAAVEAFRASVAEVLDAGREIRSGIRASMLEMIEDSERDRAKLTQERDAALAQLAEARDDLRVKRAHANSLQREAASLRTSLDVQQECTDHAREQLDAALAQLAERTRERDAFDEALAREKEAHCGACFSLDIAIKRATAAEAEVARLRELLGSARVGLSFVPDDAVSNPLPPWGDEGLVNWHRLLDALDAALAPEPAKEPEVDRG
jgi:chromosome segregation ATPase